MDMRILDDIDQEEEYAAAICVIAAMESSRIWVHPINENREEFGEFNHLMDQLKEDHERFSTYFRMTVENFYHLLDLLKPRLERCSTQFRKCIPAEERLAVCLRFLATGNSYRSLGFSFRMGFATVSTIVRECCTIIWDTLQPIYMAEPDEKRWLQISEEFESIWNYPQCVGALDGKHIQIRCPHGGGSAFYNYKGTHSIVLLAMVDANYKFIYVDVGAYGKSSDGGTFERSSFGKRLCENKLHLPRETRLKSTTDLVPYVVVADEAFPLKINLMRPYSRNTIISDEEKIYNYRHSRARRTVENAFGILAGRWRIFLKPIETQPQTADYIVLAACCLHNMLRDTHAMSPFEQRIHVNQQEINGFGKMGGIRRNPVREAALVRDKFKKFFVSSEGTANCPWQWEIIRKGKI